jgi:GcrA cell cycle regulator
MSWTDERVSLLRQLWGEGKTAAEIAKTLGGVTRNAVIGKAHRLKLSGRISPAQQNGALGSAMPSSAAPRLPTAQKLPKPILKTPVREQSLKPDQAVKARAAYVPPLPAEMFEPGQGIKLTELRERTCRWPQGDPKDDNFRFCGKETVEGLPYCAYHVRMAYQANARVKIRVEELVQIDQNIVKKTTAV